MHKWGLVLKIDRFILKGNWNMYMCNLYCRFLESILENIFCLNSLLILTFVIYVIFGRWIVHGRRLMLLSLNGAKFRILYYKQFLGRRCSIRKNFRLDDDCIWQDDKVVFAPLVLHITVFEVRTWLVEESLSRSSILDEPYSLMLSFIYKSFLTH